MRAVAVTGTNGKTTTAWLVRILLEAIEGPSAYLGTLGYLSPKGFEGLENTTPFPIDLYQLVGDAATQGCRGLAMEVSSHALDEHRADFLEFDCAIFTNLTEDHLDYHKTMEAYAEAKLRLFQDFPGYTKKPMVAVINVGDPYGAEYTKKIETPVFRYGTSDGVDLKAELLHLGVSSMRVRFTSRNEGSAESDVQLGGDFNFWNVTSAVAAMVAMGHPLTVVGGHLDKLKPVPGRFEPVINNTGVGVLIDYAHTPDALEKLLGTARKLTTKRLISLFGCGGDRQTTKRAPMGRISSQLADVTFITSDNPRTEDPRLIAEEVQSGALPGRDVRLVIDRKEAILQAIGCAEPGDVVVLAGKGHEEYQIIGREKFHMSDREMAIEALRQRGED
jgi:UDP-N-acetylmuramyl-tripeptide synthetase